MAVEFQDHVRLARAQANVYKNFLLGLTMPVRPEMYSNSDEAYVEVSVRNMCAAAYDELTTVVGIKGESLHAMKNGGGSELNDMDRTALIDHIERAHDLSAYFAYSESHGIDSTDLKNSWKHLKKNAYIMVEGPVVVIRCDNEGMRILQHFFSGKPVIGMAGPFPIHGERTGGDEFAMNIVDSEVISLIVVNVQADYEQFANFGEPQNTDQHEQWHVIDGMRRKFIDIQRGKIYRDSSGLTRTDKHIARALESELFDIGQVMEDIGSWMQYEADVFQIGDRQAVSRDDVRTRFLSMQYETTANIAGRIRQGLFRLYTQDGSRLIGNFIAASTLPFGGQEFLTHLSSYCEFDAGSRPRYDTEFDYEVASWLESLGLPTLTFTERTDWMERLVYEYLHPNGTFTGYRNHTADVVEAAFTAMHDLENIRGNGWTALFELSDLPITRWRKYVEKQMG